MRFVRPTSAPWQQPERYWPALEAATAELDPPYGVISLPALAHNAFDMLDRAAGTPIRVASTASISGRTRTDLLAYTLAEANWLATTSEHGEAIADVVVAYPTADRAALRELATSPELAARVTIMVDSIDQLDYVDAVIPPARRESIRVCLELDASYITPLFGHIGVFRSPIHTAEAARAFAAVIASRPGFTLVGMMGYEAQIAGLVNNPAGNPLRGRAVTFLQSRSKRELAERRGAAIAAVGEVTPLEFVNAGGTGSIESSVAEAGVTEVAAGSGLFGPHLFDNYTHFHPAPAASFALSVVRKPSPKTAVLMGGGWIASGPAAADRSPKLVWPAGLKMVPREMAGEVQTPLTGPAAARLRMGDRVWLRHTKAGEVSEHLDSFAVVDDGAIVATLPTYRGQGQVFL
jgi:D-serine deaminase-like pyridoxal phosphate-dependent protein